MGSLVPDGEVEEPFIREAIFEKVVDTVNVDFLFHLQLVMVREVEGDCHVGLPHAALHVEELQCVFASGNFFLVAFTIFVSFIIEFYRLTKVVNLFDIVSATWFIRLIFISWFYLTDIRCVNQFTRFIGSELQQAGGLTVGTADVQRQFVVNIDPDVIIAREKELDWNLFAIIAKNFSIICQCKIELQLCTKTIVVGVGMGYC